MARPFVAGFMLGAAVMLVTSAALGLHAQDVHAEVLEAAAAAHVDPVKLQGALNSLEVARGDKVDPYAYLQGTGELPSQNLPSQSYTSQSSARVNCIIHYESRGDAHAVNPRSGARGLAQFLPGTWRTTPQGRAGLSVFDPVANRAAAAWMLSVGRASAFDAVRFYGC